MFADIWNNFPKTLSIFRRKKYISNREPRL